MNKKKSYSKNVKTCKIKTLLEDSQHLGSHAVKVYHSRPIPIPVSGCLKTEALAVFYLFTYPSQLWVVGKKKIQKNNTIVLVSTNYEFTMQALSRPTYQGILNFDVQ